MSFNANWLGLRAGADHEAPLDGSARRPITAAAHSRAIGVAFEGITP